MNSLFSYPPTPQHLGYLRIFFQLGFPPPQKTGTMEEGKAALGMNGELSDDRTDLGIQNLFRFLGFFCGLHTFCYLE